MSQGQGPPDDTTARGPPEHVRERWKRTKRSEDGSIEVSGDRIEQLMEQVDFDDLSPAEELLFAILDANDLLEP